MAKRSIAAYESATIEIDPARTSEDGELLEPAFRIHLQVKKLTIEESAAYDRLFFRAINPEAERLTLVRRTEDERETVNQSAISQSALHSLAREVASIAPEQAVEVLRRLVTELQPTDVFVVPDDEIRRRRLLDMTAEQRARYEQARQDDAIAYSQFLAEGLRRFVKVDPGQIEWVPEDGPPVEVLNGEQLAQCYGARPRILEQIALAIRAVNEMTEAQKNDWRSRFGTDTSSAGRGPTTPGGSPAPTAAPVGPWASATSAAATVPETGPSGPTANW